MQNILGIIDSNNKIVVKYNYNAYGEILSITGNPYIGSINPFRYKGYYYDDETNLYYCNSRYYVAEWCRWLTPDSVEYLDSSNINGLNLFSYCNNNPVMYSDGSGHFPGLITAMLIGFGVGFLVGGGFEIGKQIHNNGWNLKDWNWGQIGLSALGGGVAGAISAIPIPGSGFLSYLGTFFIGGVASVTGGLISGSVNSWETAALAFGIGAVANVAARGVSDLVKHIKVSKQINAVRANANRIASMSSKKKSLEIWNLIGTDNLHSEMIFCIHYHILHPG